MASWSFAADRWAAGCARWRRVTHRPIPAALLWGGLLVGGLTLLIATPRYSRSATLRVGDISPRDVEAPYALRFESRIRTERERERAAAAVPEVTWRNAAVVAEQLRQAKALLAFINLVRTDPFAPLEEKERQLAGAEALAALTDEQRSLLVSLEDPMWQQVQSEVLQIVAQAMRQSIRPEEVERFRGGLIANVRSIIDPTLAEVVARLATPFVVANVEVDVEQTETLRQAAREAILPVVVPIMAGQDILRAGDVVTAEHLETLQRLGLQAGGIGWRHLLAVLLVMSIFVLAPAAGLHQLKARFWLGTRAPAVIVGAMLLCVLAARYTVPAHGVLSFAFPAPAVAMMLTVMLGLETGLFSAVVLAAAIGMLAGSTNLEMALYVLAGSIVGAVALHRVRRMSAFLVAGAVLVATNVTLAVAYQLQNPVLDLEPLTEHAAAAVANGLLSPGLAAVGVLAAGTLLRMTTPIHLLELARPDHPLLRQLQLLAPGTYQHSIVLSNLAEAAASAVGADVLEVRVGAYYHDIGKSIRPYFFIENQLGGTNPHDGLDPRTSAEILIEHVVAGAALGQRHRLPDSVIDFILEHHGTTRVEYFYCRAVQQLGLAQVDEAAFHYPGPRPRSPETAIVMLADAAEAAVRAAGPSSREEIDEIVAEAIGRRLAEAQLDDSRLTLHDVVRIRRAFVDVLRSMYHPRIKYPAGVTPATATATPAAPAAPPTARRASRKSDRPSRPARMRDLGPG